MTDNESRVYRLIDEALADGMVSRVPDQSSKLNLGVLDALPKRHADFIVRYGSLSAYGGYFGILANSKSESLFVWNSKQTWKFAWAERVDGYYCFALDGFGSQYAYKTDGAGQIRDTTVFALDFASLEPLDVAEDFDQFVVDEFLHNAAKPFEDYFAEARAQTGNLLPGKLVGFAPPGVLFEDPFSSAQKTILPSVEAMVFAGDAATQFDGAGNNETVTGVEKYFDDRGRARLRLIFA